MTEPGPGQYRCAICRGIFVKAWTDEEATAEADGHGLDHADCDLVCDDCYKETPWGKVAPLTSPERP